MYLLLYFSFNMTVVGIYPTATQMSQKQHYNDILTSSYGPL